MGPDNSVLLINSPDSSFVNDSRTTLWETLTHTMFSSPFALSCFEPLHYRSFQYLSWVPSECPNQLALIFPGLHLTSVAWIGKSYIFYIFFLQTHTSQAFIHLHSPLKASVNCTLLEDLQSSLSQSDSCVFQSRSFSSKYISSVSCKPPCYQRQTYLRLFCP